MKRCHYYHMVNPSPWPILAAISLFSALIGVTLIVHSKIIGISLTLYNLFWFYVVIKAWFADIVREATYEGKHTQAVQKGLRLGMILFILSEVMLFFSFFWSYFHFALSPSIEEGSTWPPYGIQAFDHLHVPLYNTIILLLSGICVTWTHNEVVIKNNSNKFNSFYSLALTLLLATHFTLWQIKEYNEGGFHIADSNYGSIFFLATGFHGFHVLLGTFLLGGCFVRMWKFHFTRDHHLGLEFSIWYWHFVDVVWLFLYIVIYWWSAAATYVL